MKLTPKSIAWAIATAKVDPHLWSHEHGCTPLQALTEAAQKAAEMASLILSFGQEDDCTSYPLWAIVIRKRGQIIWLAGPWFDRKHAEGWLRAKSYRYAEDAEVYCLSGSESRQYQHLMDLAKDVWKTPFSDPRIDRDNQVCEGRR